jgi:hypothetical protein
LRERAAAFSLPLLAERIGSAVPPWVTSRMVARHWLSSMALGLTLGLGLGIPLRLALGDAADGPSAASSIASSTELATSAGTMVAAVPAPPAVVPSPDVVASVSTEAARPDARLPKQETVAQRDDVPSVSRVARAKPASKARAQRIAAAKKRARAAAHRRASDRRATRSTRRAKPSSNPRTIAAYLSERARASRVAKYTPR